MFLEKVNPTLQIRIKFLLFLSIPLLSDYSGAFVIIKYKMLDFSVLNISFNGFRNFTLCFFRTRLFGLRYLLQYKHGQQENPSIIIPFVFGHSQGSELTVGVFFCCHFSMTNYLRKCFFLYIKLMSEG